MLKFREGGDDGLQAVFGKLAVVFDDATLATSSNPPVRPLSAVHYFPTKGDSLPVEDRLNTDNDGLPSLKPRARGR
jgi:hypothetical protein